MKIDDKPSFGKFGRPKTTDNFIHPKINNKDEYYRNIPELQDYVRDYEDPSLGQRHLDKVYPYSQEVDKYLRKIWKKKIKKKYMI